MSHQHMNRHTSKYNKLQIPEIVPSKYGNLIFDKGSISNHWDKNRLFNNLFWNKWLATWKRIKLHLH